jgi:hypothetical protein
MVILRCLFYKRPNDDFRLGITPSAFTLPDFSILSMDLRGGVENFHPNRGILALHASCLCGIRSIVARNGKLVKHLAK